VGEKVFSAYVSATYRIPDYFEKIQAGTAPSKFTVDFLEKLGFKNKSDRNLILLLKGLGFFDESNTPTSVYRAYLDETQSRAVLGKQVRIAYEGLFEIDRNANHLAPPDLKGKFKTILNASDQVSTWMFLTFAKICSIADFEIGAPAKSKETKEADREPKENVKEKAPAVDRERETGGNLPEPLSLGYRFEIHLPNTTDVDVYRAIFKALREHLRD
jgi:Family of unknown function (DUF5343)